MKIFLDFDDTLFNTRDFIQASRMLYVDHGITPEMYKGAWEELREARGLKNMSYDFDAHMGVLHTKCDFDETRLRHRMEKFYAEDTPNYVFPDGIPFLQELKRLGHELILVSFKTGDFQDKKIAASGLAPYFDNAVVGIEEKGIVIARLFSADTDGLACFVDDRLYQIEDVKKALPDMVTIHMQRPEGRYQEESDGHCDYTVHDAAEALEIIKTLE